MVTESYTGVVAQNRFSFLTAPNASVSSLLGVKVARMGSGSTSTFKTNYDYSAARAALSPVNTFWVDNATGSNNNAGTQLAPFRSIDLAVKMVADTGALGCVKVKGNSAKPTRYLATATQARSGQSTNNATWKDALANIYTDIQVIIEPWNSGELFDSWGANTTNPVWTATSDANIWKNSSANPTAWDYTNLNATNAPRPLYELNLASGTSEATAIANMNSLYTTYSGLSDLGGPTYALGVICRIASTATYIRLCDNRNPNSDTNIQLGPAASASSPAQFKASAANPTIFLVGMGFGAGLYIEGVNSFRPKVNTAFCRFIGGNYAGALACDGATNLDGCDVIHYQSTASGGQNDGFNYHENCKFVEIGCTGYWNGWNTILTNNGTTCHESCLGIRVGGSYLNNQDRSLHDVTNAITWNLGLTSSTRRGADASPQSTPYAVGIDGTAGTAKIYLDACHVANGANGAPQYTSQSNYTNSTLYYANLDFTPVIGPSSTPGSLSTYTP